jgi:hypothetical protein
MRPQVEDVIVTKELARDRIKGRWLGNDTYGRGCSVELMVISGIDEKMEKSSNRRKHFYANSSSNAFASFRSRVSNPSVNQP